MFTLFNLQGTPGGFHRFCFASSTVSDLGSAYLYYHIHFRLSTTFSFSFENVFVVFLEISVFFRFSRSSLHIIQPKTLFVNNFFRFFSFCIPFVNSALLTTIPSGFPVPCIQDTNHFYRTAFPIPKLCPISASPGRFKFMTVQIPTPARPYSLTRSSLYCQLRTSSNHTT